MDNKGPDILVYANGSFTQAVYNNGTTTTNTPGGVAVYNATTGVWSPFANGGITTGSANDGQIALGSYDN